VVNRDDVDEALMGWIMENGYSYLEEQEEKAQQIEAQKEIVRRVSRSKYRLDGQEQNHCRANHHRAFDKGHPQVALDGQRLRYLHRGQQKQVD